MQRGGEAGLRRGRPGPRRLQRVRGLHRRALGGYKVGVYSSAGVWTSIFGTGTDSLIADTYEWTYEPETTNYSGAYPYGWCLNHGSGPCAQFFGGQTSSSPYALMWQWSGGGAGNGVGDFDQIDATRQS